MKRFQYPNTTSFILFTVFCFFFFLSIWTRWSLWSFSNLKFHSKFCSVNFPFSTLERTRGGNWPHQTQQHLNSVWVRAGIQITLLSRTNLSWPTSGLLLVPGERVFSEPSSEVMPSTGGSTALNHIQARRLLFTCHIYDHRASVSKSLKILERL